MPDSMLPVLTGGPVMPTTGVLAPVPPDAVRLTGGLWADRQALNGSVILEHCRTWMERIGWIANFDAAADGSVGERRFGVPFLDSEVYKLLEAMAWELGRSADATLQRTYDGLVARVAAAQEADGYLHTAFGRAGQAPRYSDLRWGHELYCAGHLIQAAVARLRTGHDDQLPAVARRLADHLWVEFGPEGRPAFCGHPEVEAALVEFGRALDEPRYIELARLMVDRRGHGTLEATLNQGLDYWLDDVPVRDATVLRGHAVRALYLASGALDVAVETGDEHLLNSVRAQVDRTIARRTYITGGMGARHENEAFGEDFELPSDRSYCESCAAIASVMTSWRLLLATGEEGYADLIERTLLNAFLVSTREDGRAFFYANTLHQRHAGSEPGDDAPNELADAGLRVPWFEVSCCPTNIARTYASVSGYFVTTDTAGVQLQQYAPMEVRTALSDGTAIELDVATGYPFAGEVTVTVRAAATFTLSLRIPAWAQGATAEFQGEPLAVPAGLLAVRRAFSAGEILTLHLPLEPRIVRPDPRVDAIQGSFAVERGPLVLCLESPDLPDGVAIDEVVARSGADLRLTADGADATFDRRVEGKDGWPYGDARASVEGEPFRASLRPYYAWGNRGPATMRVWLPAAES